MRAVEAGQAEKKTRIAHRAEGSKDYVGQWQTQKSDSSLRSVLQKA